MKHLWVLRKGAHRKYTDHTDMTEIYTIFGDSTWPKSGVIAEKPSPYNNTVLVWRDALDVLTTQVVGTTVRHRMKLTGYQIDDGNVNARDIMSCLTFGQWFFTSFKPDAKGPDEKDKNMIKWIGNYIEWGQPNRIHLSKLIADMSANHDADVICAEAAYCLASLSRICGYSNIIVCKMYRPDPTSNASDHEYNLCQGNIYDATPHQRQDPESKQRKYASPTENHSGRMTEPDQTNRSITPKFLIH